tara:strand:- start:183 stop:659 length:477 start_codon:yes stop_codon:yes gene_type:complete
MKNTNKYRQIRKSCTRAYDEATLVYPLKVRDVGAIRKRSFQHHRAVIVRDTPTLEAVLDYDNSENEELIDEGCNIVLKLTDPSQALEGLLVYAHSIDWEDKEMSKKKKYYVGVSIMNCYEVEAKDKEEAEEIVRNYSDRKLLEDNDFNVNYIDEVTSF